MLNTEEIYQDVVRRVKEYFGLKQLEDKKNKKRNWRQYIIHVNQHVIKSNRKNNKTDPVLTCKYNGESATYAHEAVIKIFGIEIGRVVYRPNNPLGCGAHVWIYFNTGLVDIEHVVFDEEES